MITTGNFPKAHWPGVKSAFGDGYNMHPAQYSQIAQMVTSDKSYEEYVGVSGFGLAQTKNEGDSFYMDTARQGFVTRLTNVAIGLGFTVTFEAKDDAKFLPSVPKEARKLGRSIKQSEEELFALLLSRAFNSTYKGADGLELCSLLHVNKAGGTYANELTTGADISEAAIEDLITLIMQATDDRGNKIQLMPQKLVVAPADSFDAYRILGSVLQNNTANNAINVLKSQNLIPGGIVVNNYFDAGLGAFFITTDADDGLMFQRRKDVTFNMFDDPDTLNTKFTAFSRLAVGWADPRGCYGSVGAS